MTFLYNKVMIDDFPVRKGDRLWLFYTKIISLMIFPYEKDFVDDENVIVDEFSILK